MPFAPIFAITAPLIGLLILLLTALLPFPRPYRRFVVSAAVGLAFIGVLFAPLEPARTVPISRWQPSAFLGIFPSLRAGQEVWPLALALSCATLAAVLVQSSRVAPPNLALELSTLWMLATGLGGLWGENLLTVLAAWAGFDLAWGLGAAATGLPAHRVALGASTNGLATALLWAGALAVSGQGSISWSLASLDGPGGELLLLAALLRIGLYPFHLALPGDGRWNLPESATLLSGPLLGWGLLVRLATASGQLPPAPWLEGAAATTFIAGGMLAWSQSNRGGGWPWGSLASIGGVLWASLHAGRSILPTLTAGAVAWTLGVNLLHLDRGLDRNAPWWSVGAVMGGLSLIGAPLTPGAIPSASLLGAIVTSPSAQRILVFLVGQGLLTASVARRVLKGRSDPAESGPLYIAARIAGIALPLLLLLAGAVRPTLLKVTGESPVRPGVAGWGIWTVGVGAGAFLSWQEQRIRKRLELALGLLHDILRLEWLVRLILRSLDRVTAFLSAVADVAEGPGAILWALSIFFLILLAIAGL